MRDLIFWRHAEAEDFSASGLDTDRALTKRGRKDAAKVAKWLNRHLSADTKILASPALRCQQTVAALHAINPMAVTAAEWLSISGNPQQMMEKFAEYADNNALLIVGHQPNLGFVIAKYSGLAESTVSVKKGAVWWLRHSPAYDGIQYRIYTVMLPD